MGQHDKDLETLSRRQAFRQAASFRSKSLSELPTFSKSGLLDALESEASSTADDDEIQWPTRQISAPAAALSELRKASAETLNNLRKATGEGAGAGRCIPEDAEFFGPDGACLEFDGGAPEPRRKASRKTLSAEEGSLREALIKLLAEMAEGCRAEIEWKCHQAERQRSMRRSKTTPASVLLAASVASRARSGPVGPVHVADDQNEEGYEAAQEECVVIFFDWDDTLLPTWFITDVVYPCHPEAKNGPLPETSDFYAPLAEHAQIVRTLLTAVAEMGRVAIVTLARRDWVLASAERYLPGVDWPQLFEELRIRVLYAREHLPRKHAAFAQGEDGVNPFVLAKRNAMAKVIRRLTRKRQDSRLNVISVGDSTVEREAVKEVMWSYEGDAKYLPLCKTVKLMDDPPLKHLSGQLTIMSAWINRLSHHDGDFDLNLDDRDDVESKMNVLIVP